MPRLGIRSPRGTTLLELLITLSILALVAAVTMPALAGAVDRERFKATARELVAALKEARLAALQRGGDAVLRLDVEERTYAIANAPAKALQAPAGTELTLVTATTERFGESSGNIRFFSDGSSTGGAVTLTFAGRKRLVRVDWLTGRIQVSE
jgi:general secretion pathway protein H